MTPERDEMGHRFELGQPRGAHGSPVAPPIGIHPVDIRRFVIDLASARSKEKFDCGGAWIWAIDSDGTDAALDIHFNQPIGDPMTFQRGQLLAGKRFDTLYLTNAAQAGATLTLHISLDASLIVQNSVSVAGLTQIVRAGTHAHAAVAVGVAAVAVLAANSNRYRAWIQAAFTNTDLIHVGSSNAVTTANSGRILSPGDGDWFSGTDALWAISGTASQEVRYFSEAA